MSRRDTFGGAALAAQLVLPSASAFGQAGGSSSFPFLRGINLVGSNRYIGANTWPTEKGMDYWLGLGMNCFRITAMWENLQPRLLGPLHPGNRDGLLRTVSYLSAGGAYPIVELHNSARYKTSGRDDDPGSVVGESAVTAEMFADVWAKLAELFKADPRVILEPTNEPHDQDTDILVRTYNIVIAAIRATGARNLILLDGNGYSNAASWMRSYDGSVANGVAMLGIVDPIDNVAFSPHQYLDDMGGKLETCVAGAGTRYLGGVTDWARRHRKRLLLGEFGGGENAACHREIAAMIRYVEANSDVWMGWTYFAAYAGQRPYLEPDTFFLGIDPKDYDNPVENGRIRTLRQFLTKR
ncbi:glycoside hydrolase family 5 protein [Enterovirga aerilata]|uniref:Glycoside hydrolase family 5 protein n=1 Tax=Enterovirga aerilata TaxID=2730920 RepID=A0A849HUV8_9HYPH|nr:glycoside hydrolase family 5 protein [Enterovirga sp. DB1703]NNM71276.1 glycoside hydrolase family 5 protein [Enterovirga sp. DB1703]